MARSEILISYNSGDIRPGGAAMSELLITTALDTGSTTCSGERLDDLLAGGDKSSQAKDIEEALLLAANLTEVP